MVLTAGATFLLVAERLLMVLTTGEKISVSRCEEDRCQLIFVGCRCKTYHNLFFISCFFCSELFSVSTMRFIRFIRPSVVFERMKACMFVCFAHSERESKEMEVTAVALHSLADDIPVK